MRVDRVDRMERWAGPAAGIVAGIVSMTGLAMSDFGGLPEEISPFTSGETIARVITENKDRLELGTTILMVGLFFMVWFLVHIQTRLNPTGTTRWTASVASVGGLITITLMALVIAYVRASLQAPFSGPDAVIPKAIVVFDCHEHGQNQYDNHHGRVTAGRARHVLEPLEVHDAEADRDQNAGQHRHGDLCGKRTEGEQHGQK